MQKSPAYACASPRNMLVQLLYPVFPLPNKTSGKGLLQLVDGNRLGQMTVHTGQMGPICILGKCVRCHGDNGEFIDAFHS